MLHRILIDYVDVEPCAVSVSCVSGTLAYCAGYELSFLSHCITNCLQLRNNGCSAVGVVVNLSYQVVRSGVDTSDKFKTCLNTADLLPGCLSE